MSNFVQVKMSAEEAAKAAQNFGRLNEKELKVREFFEKYQTIDPDELEKTDADAMKTLRNYFMDGNKNAKAVYDNLRNNGLLMELDWMQGSDDLQKHFGHYLDTLKESKLEQMILYGGLNVIDTTVKWERFSDADKLLKNWIENIPDDISTEEIFNFSQTYLKRKHYWSIAGLLEDYLKNREISEPERISIQALRGVVLFELSEAMKDSSGAKTDKVIAQAAWASQSVSIDDLYKIIKECLTETKPHFDSIKEPNRTQMSIMGKLQKIAQTINQEK